MKKYERARNLDDKAIEDIVAILDGWTGKLTWDLLVDAVHKRLRQSYTRQALHNHARIADAFRLRKQSLAGATSKVKPKPKRASDAAAELDAALQRIALLEGQAERLQMENNRLLEQFVRWAYNAHLKGADKAWLDRPLHTPERDTTKVTMADIRKRRS